MWFDIICFSAELSQRTFVEALNGLKISKGIKNLYFAVFNGVDGSKVTYGYGYIMVTDYGLLWRTIRKTKKNF